MKRWASAALIVSLAAPGLLACEQKKGPMEKTGEKIDEATDKILHPNEGPLEKAGRKTDEAIENAKKKLEKKD